MFETAFNKKFNTFTPTSEEIENLEKIEGKEIYEEGSFYKEFNGYWYLYIQGKLSVKIQKAAQPTQNFPSGGIVNKN